MQCPNCATAMRSGRVRVQPRRWLGWAALILFDLWSPVQHLLFIEPDGKEETVVKAFAQSPAHRCPSCQTVVIVGKQSA